MPDLPLRFDERGLVPVVVLDYLTGEIRMQAFATREAVLQTLETGRATFFSRSRSEIWEKGKTSGNGIHVRGVLVDCDGDSLVYLGDPEGPSCHTGAQTCFFRTVAPPGAETLIENDPPQTLLATLERVLESRKGSTESSSYTKSLYDHAPAAIGAKIREEGGELAQALESETDDRVVSEAADVLYHLLVGLRWRNISVRLVFAELARRLGKSGHVEKASR